MENFIFLCSEGKNVVINYLSNSFTEHNYIMITVILQKLLLKMGGNRVWLKSHVDITKNSTPMQSSLLVKFQGEYLEPCQKDFTMTFEEEFSKIFIRAILQNTLRKLILKSFLWFLVST